MHVSVTRLRLRSIGKLMIFQIGTLRIAAQLAFQGGFREGRTFAASSLEYWTLTSWDDATSMRVFRDQGPHRGAKTKGPSWCDEMAFASWHAPEGPLPSWEDAARRLQENGVFPTLADPSENHLAKRVSLPTRQLGGGTFRRGFGAYLRAWLPILVPLFAAVGAGIWLLVR